ncbi:benzoate/H(+) symporter BenE family transporter [Massilia dura]|uniref:Benzoate/H(+) symporter BenE family transporter n=1 Tax=Pseudoduganella dura TaxID=321982 RepID=A0A6I3X472_9BURK|nr:benzoate/H(+) symporter BenE family transporter [Pseudoduganella dura]MUI10987.1 benzoate/H(+) symporter BenE family transporter [Pseudoduganella dura]GGY18538.1 benzoate transporter [Pseudoduganella dura]
MTDTLRPVVTEPAGTGAPLTTLLPAIVAGFLAVLVSFAGPLAIFYQAAQAAGVDAATFASWVWSIAIGAGVAGIWLSVRYRVPVITAWSAPGTALLITLFPALSVAEAIGAYITAAAILLVLGLTGGVDRIMRHIPQGVAAGMMAGILLPFGLNAFRGVGSLPAVAIGMIAAWLFCRRMLPRYTVVAVLAAGIALALGTGRTDFGHVAFALAIPRPVAPEWSVGSTFSLALPLVLVTLTGQYLPGMALLKASGYGLPARPVMVANSVVSLLVAATGGITIAIAAITAAMCTGPDAHEDPGKRYMAGVANGVFYLLAGLCAGSIVALFAALPKELVATVAGLALLGPIGANLGAMMAAREREAALITFIATASGMTFLGLGSAFWGIAIGIAAHCLLTREQGAPTPG